MSCDCNLTPERSSSPAPAMRSHGAIEQQNSEKNFMFGHLTYYLTISKNFFAFIYNLFFTLQNQYNQNKIYYDK